MIGWEEHKLGDILEIGRGASPRPIKNYVTDNPGIPWVKIADATKSINRYIERTNEYIIEEGRRKTVYPGELIVSNSATPGIPKLMKIEACVHDGWLVFDKYKNIETLYLYYFFLDYRRILAHSASGTVFKNLTTEIVRDVRINLPPIPEQKAIAKVLTAFDDKIDLLQAQNKTLDTMAQTIFKEWFGKYQIGDELPEGWRFGVLGEIVTPLKGKNLTKKQVVPGAYPVIAGGLKPSVFHNICNTKVPVLTVSASGANAGYVALHHTPVWSSDSSFIDKSFTDSFYFIYVFLKNNQSLIYDKQEGSAIPHVYPHHLENLELVIPKKLELEKYEKVAENLFNKISNNKSQIHSLTKTRDTLLPKLISGQVRVNNLKQTKDA